MAEDEAALKGKNWDRPRHIVLLLDATIHQAVLHGPHDVMSNPYYSHLLSQTSSLLEC